MRKSPTSPKIHFVVIDGNMLGYVLPETPLQAGILSSSVIRGASFPAGGTYPLRIDGTDVRPATGADFDDFRLCTAGYASDPAYDFPAR